MFAYPLQCESVIPAEHSPRSSDIIGRLQPTGYAQPDGHRLRRFAHRLDSKVPHFPGVRANDLRGLPRSIRAKQRPTHDGRPCEPRGQYADRGAPDPKPAQDRGNARAYGRRSKPAGDADEDAPSDGAHAYADHAQHLASPGMLFLGRVGLLAGLFDRLFWVLEGCCNDFFVDGAYEEEEGAGAAGVLLVRGDVEKQDGVEKRSKVLRGWQWW